MTASNYRIEIEKALKEGSRTLADSCSTENLAVLEKLTQATIKSFQGGGKVMLCGNGGSASQAQHIAAEFVGRFKRERKGLPSLSLTVDTSVLTSLGNDYGYETIFARQVESLGRAGDILIGLSTSGNSPNVIKAVEKALSMGITVAVLTGARGGKLAAMTSLVFRSASDDTAHVQEAHITALHAVCDRVEAAFST